MANPEHVAILEQGVEVWNNWRDKNRDVIPDLREILINKTEIQRTVLDKADLEGVNFERARLHRANLQGANLQKANLQEAALWQANLQKAELRLANLERADLEGANLRKAELWRANLVDADLQGVDFEEAYLKETNLQGSALWWANLQRTHLSWANLQGATLWWANLQEANLWWANLQGANLQEANLQGAFLQRAIFQEAILTRANLQEANLQEANLSGASIREANLSRTNVEKIGYNNSMSCRNAIVIECTGSQRFVRHVMDLDYIEETKEKHPKRYMFWKWTSDCGRSWERWALWSICIALFFGTVFLPSIWWEHFPHWLQAVLPHLNFNVPGMDVSFYTPYYFSIVTFTTLGFGDITPLNLAGQIWLTLEVVAGYIMLGGLITLFATKMVRQSG